MNKGDFRRDQRAKWLLCSFTVKPALPTCSQHQQLLRRGKKGGVGQRCWVTAGGPFHLEGISGEEGGGKGLAQLGTYCFWDRTVFIFGIHVSLDYSIYNWAKWSSTMSQGHAEELGSALYTHTQGLD